MPSPVPDGKFQDLGDEGRDPVRQWPAAIDSGRIVGTVGALEGAEGGEADQTNPFVFFQGVFTVFGTGQLTSEARRQRRRSHRRRRLQQAQRDLDY